jgi:LysR family glycine cleavage system transcriptional activator
MPKLRSRLPPMNSLAVFEAVARHLSLTRAGEELCISREAVSRQMRGLEEYLGVKLLARLHRAVALTDAGKKFLPVVHASLEDIAKCSDQLRRENLNQKVTVSATIAISTLWLTPRLARFQADYPDIEIDIAVSDVPLDMASKNIDLGLRYGDGHWPAHQATKLFEVESFPICSRDYLDTAPALNSPEDLRAHRLITLSGLYHDQENWKWWLEGHGIQVAPSRNLSFDSYANVLQMALDGQGVALGFSPLVDTLLEQKKLLRPITQSLATSFAVYLVSPNKVPRTPQARQFIEWILAQSTTA